VEAGGWGGGGRGGGGWGGGGGGLIGGLIVRLIARLIVRFIVRFIVSFILLLLLPNPRRPLPTPFSPRTLGSRGKLLVVFPGLLLLLLPHLIIRVGES